MIRRVKLRLLAAVLVLLLVGGCSPGFVDLGDGSAAHPGGMPDYEREAFGDGWADFDGDCQDTRQEILIRDLVDEKLDRAGCRVLTGTLHDLYTGAVISFRRGQETSDDVQIDHIVPLSYAWRAGAWQWTDAEREVFANDPIELLAVDGATNNSKGDRGPSRWLLPNRDAHCAYAADWQEVVSAYALVIDPRDAAALEEILSGC
jgi:hypothetical protein